MDAAGSTRWDRRLWTCRDQNPIGCSVTATRQRPPNGPRETVRATCAKTLDAWSEANGGTFLTTSWLRPVGDEGFSITSHMNGLVRQRAVRDTATRAQSVRGEGRQGRTYAHWGSRIYVAEAPRVALTQHESCAQVVGVVRDEIAKSAPGMLLSGNTTRAGVFDRPTTSTVRARNC
jgi:hypothetical protein